MNGVLQKRQATYDDMEFLSDLRERTMRRYVELTWGDWNEEFQRDAFNRWFVPETMLILLLDNERVGVLNATTEPEYIYLRSIYVAPEYQSQGIGSTVIREVLAEAQSAGLPVRLRVLRVNPAKQLYEQLGFRTVEETETHYIMWHDGAGTGS